MPSSPKAPLAMKSQPEARRMVETRRFIAIANPRNSNARKKKTHFHIFAVEVGLLLPGVAVPWVGYRNEPTCFDHAPRLRLAFHCQRRLWAAWHHALPRLPRLRDADD